MASMPEHIAQYLDTQVVSLVASNPGRNVFVDQIPADPAVMVSLRQTMGRRVQRAMRGGGTGIVCEQPGLQITIRHTTYEGADSLAKEVFTALDNFVGTLSGIRYLHVEAAHSPQSLGVDEDKRYRFVINFGIRKEIG